MTCDVWRFHKPRCVPVRGVRPRRFRFGTPNDSPRQLQSRCYLLLNICSPHHRDPAVPAGEQARRMRRSWTVSARWGPIEVLWHQTLGSEPKSKHMSTFQHQSECNLAGAGTPPASDRRPISHLPLIRLEYQCFDAAEVLQVCASVASQGGNSMARKVGQIVARGDRTWLIRVYLDRDHETQKRKIFLSSNRTARA